MHMMRILILSFINIPACYRREKDTNTFFKINASFSKWIWTLPHDVSTAPLSPLAHNPSTSLHDNCPDFLCNPDDIRSLISRITMDTASCPDGISSIMLHNTAPSISLPLSIIFNSSLSTGIFPSDWKNSNIVPIPKSKASSSSPSDYHPISLLSLPSKILERHIFNYLYKFCSANNILSNCQFGFQPGFSTETAILSTINSWFSSLDRKNAVCVVFFDLTKAFDSVPHEPLLDSLSLLDLPTLLLPWLHSYL